jgi:hypothetical protein
MTPKLKAIELINKYQKLDIEIGGQYDGYLTMKLHDAKQCALIAVDVILIDCGAKDWSGDEACDGKNYWLEVKTEINNL